MGQHAVGLHLFLKLCVLQGLKDLLSVLSSGFSEKRIEKKTPFLKSRKRVTDSQIPVIFCVNPMHLEKPEAVMPEHSDVRRRTHTPKGFWLIHP